MTPELPRNRLPGINLTIGFAAFFIGLAAKETLPTSFANSASIQLPCAFFSAVFLPLGTWLALRALITERLAARQHLAQFLSGLISGLVILSGYFSVCFIILNGLNLQKEMPDVLPKMIEVAQTSSDLDKRENAAAFAYKMYGATIPYVGPDHQLSNFVPSQDEKIERQQSVKDDVRMRYNMGLLKKYTEQLAYLFGLYAGTYTTAFLVGGAILLIRGSEKQPRDSILSTP